MESDGEIEYLDEDAELVQQCVEQLPTPVTLIKVKRPDYDEEVPTQRITRSKIKKKEDYKDYNLKRQDSIKMYASPRSKLQSSKVQKKKDTQTDRQTDNTDLLVQRPTRNRKRKLEEKDSDYDPTGESDIASDSSIKKRKTLSKKPTLPVDSTLIIPKYQALQANDIIARKQSNIHIPDYDDPLCLPVRALVNSEYAYKTLRTWNNSCIEILKRSHKRLKPEKGEIMCSRRITVLRNVNSTVTGEIDTKVYSKTTVLGTEGGKKSEISELVLPKYRERKALRPFNFTQMKKRTVKQQSTVLLTKETSNEGDSLVVYNADEAVSAIYKLYQKKVPGESGEGRRALHEVGFCRSCASCYQASWRGNKNIQPRERQYCPICKRPAISVYNMLTHLRAHSDRDIRLHKHYVSKLLAETVEYHYCCRICQKRTDSIRDLREHVRSTHKVSTPFTCEIGNHLTA